jgi:LemA protein
MGFEKKVLTEVTEARASAIAAGASGPQEQAAAENQLTGALRSLFAVVENYPELKANQNVLSLQEQLATTEDQISGARDGYNAAVRSYNTAIASFPMVLMASMMGFHRREFFVAVTARGHPRLVAWPPPAEVAPECASSSRRVVAWSPARGRSARSWRR